MAAAPIRPAAPDTPDTPDVGGDRSWINTIRPQKWSAGDFESLENLIRHGDSKVIARVNRARTAVPESMASWLRRYGGDPHVRARRSGA